MAGRYEIAILLIVIAVVFQHSKKQANVSPEEAIAEYWRKLDVEMMTHKKIMVGLNVNLDMILSGPKLLKELNVRALPPEVLPVFQTLEDLSRMLAYSMMHCAALERAFNDTEKFEEIVAAAEKLPHEVFIGGNAALMAQKMAELTGSDTSVYLGGLVGKTLGQSFHPRITYKLRRSAKEEIHMILEYSKGDKWGDVQADCANRLIFSNDITNSEMTELDNFMTEVGTSSPDVVVISGLHMLEQQPRNFRMKKILTLVSKLQTIEPYVNIHLELASISNEELIRDILVLVLPHISSLGLNEQELKSLLITGSGPSSLTNSQDYPTIGVVADMLYWLMTMTSSRLSRIHFHSLQFHIIAHQNNSWLFNHVAVTKGAEIAGKQACDDDEIVPEKMKLQIPTSFKLSTQYQQLEIREHVFDPTNPTVSWSRNDILFDFSPVLVCRRPLKTVGLGDAISSVGLLYSLKTGPGKMAPYFPDHKWPYPSMI